MLRRKMVYGILVFVLVFISCGDRPNTVPYTRVNFSVLINATELIHDDRCDYFHGKGRGVGGTVIYHCVSTFYAYDCACPYDWKEGGRVVYNFALQLVCDECGSAFNILDGSPMNDSKAKNSLRRYNTQLSDDMMTLWVYN